MTGTKKINNKHVLNPRPYSVFCHLRPCRGGGWCDPPWRFKTKGCRASRKKPEACSQRDLAIGGIFFGPRFNIWPTYDRSKVNFSKKSNFFNFLRRWWQNGKRYQLETFTIVFPDPFSIVWCVFRYNISKNSASDALKVCKHWVTLGVWPHWPDPDTKMNYKKQSTVPEMDKKFEIRASKKPERQSARDNYRSTEVTDLTLTFSDLQNVNGHCANVKSASCDPKQSISVSGQSAFISMWSDLQVSANLAGGCSLYDVITLWPDMTLIIFFTKSCAKDAPEGTENFSKLSQKVRRVAKKNLRGGGGAPTPPPPARARVKLVYLFRQWTYDCCRW